MKLRILLLVLAMTGAPAVLAKKPAPTLSDTQVRAVLISESIRSYPGNCPCPYNTASNGSSCGRRRAYSRGGGYSPLCYPKDVTTEMITDYRRGAH
ncbi:hypothetical protein [Xanthomonas citri]|uniref:hypothetical protein n=1 Tax=Xanthomonas citri TaxID=346 RepID=UPI00103AAD1D|nr:hypothetical protein [Xanthomonas citri]